MNTVKEGLLFVTDFKQDLSQHMDIYWIDHLLNHTQSLQITSDKYAMALHFNRIPTQINNLFIKTRIVQSNVLQYYATFKVRKFESLFCKINIFLYKKYLLHWIAGRASILCKYIMYIFFQFLEWLLQFLFYFIQLLVVKIF